MIFTTAVISDIHFGAISPDQLYIELKEQFLKFIDTHYIDMVVIAGDFYNSILSLNSYSAIKSFSFINELVFICENKGVKYIRIIEGTLSHDNFQILNFRMHESNDKVDFKIITKVESEVLCNGIKILYIPEEYMEDMKEFYKDFINVPKKYYDFIFGHGMFKETSFVKDDGERNISKAPIWDSKLLTSITKGPIFFGHIHISQRIRKHIYYTGSFSRWVYGEEEPKGFYIFSYDTITRKYLVDFIENKLARYFDTLTVELDQFLKEKPIEELIRYAKNIKRNNLRLNLIISDSNENENITHSIVYLKEYYTGKSGYKLVINDMREKIQKEKSDMLVNKLMSDYDFLFKKELPIETKIHKFIKRKYQKEVSEEIIKELLISSKEK